MGVPAVFCQHDDLVVFRMHVFDEVAEVIPHMQGYPVPVIEARPLDLPALQGESQGANQVQGGTGAKAGPADIAGVPVHFR